MWHLPPDVDKVPTPEERVALSEVGMRAGTEEFAETREPTHGATYSNLLE